MCSPWRPGRGRVNRGVRSDRRHPRARAPRPAVVSASPAAPRGHDRPQVPDIPATSRPRRHPRGINAVPHDTRRSRSTRLRKGMAGTARCAMVSGPSPPPEREHRMRSIDLLIDSQLRRWELERIIARRSDLPEGRTPVAKPIITLSREHGSGGGRIAADLALRFGYTLLHRDTVNQMCRSTGYQRRLVEALDERNRSEISNWIDGMLAGTYLDGSDYVRALYTTIQSIAQLGGVVVVGRGANIIVGLDRGFHARVVAPRALRIENLVTRKGLPLRDAAHEVDARDHERREFIRKMFGRSVDDPLSFDVIVNEAGRSPDELVDWLEAAARTKFARLRSAAEDVVGARGVVASPRVWGSAAR